GAVNSAAHRPPMASPPTPNVTKVVDGEAPIAPLCDVSRAVPRGQRLRGRDGASGPAREDRDVGPLLLGAVRGYGRERAPLAAARGDRRSKESPCPVPSSATHPPPGRAICSPAPAPPPWRPRSWAPSTSAG